MKKLIIMCAFFTINATCWAQHALNTEHWQTSNGARVVFHQTMEIPMLDVSVAFAAGSAYDEAQFGLSALTTRLLDQGNSGLSAGNIADQFAEIGAQYGGASSRDAVIISLRTLTQPNTLDKASHLFAQLLNHPDFPQDAFLREQNQQIMAIAQSHESPDVIADETFYQLLYGQHPYAHPIDGTLETVKQITRQDVQRFYQQYFVGSNAVVILVGAIDSTKAHEIAERITHDLPQGMPAKTVALATSETKEYAVEIKHPSSQTVLRVGQLGITHANKDYFPLQVGSYILGGGSLVSILADELREKRGLTYGVSSQFLPMPGIGPFIISLSTKNNQSNQALAITHQVVSTFVAQGPTQAQLVAAKHYLTGSFPLSLASNRSIADMLLKIAFYHLPENFIDTYIDSINAVTTKQIVSAFQQQVHPEHLLQVSVGSS